MHIDIEAHKYKNMETGQQREHKDAKIETHKHTETVTQKNKNIKN